MKGKERLIFFYIVVLQRYWLESVNLLQRYQYISTHKGSQWWWSEIMKIIGCCG